MKYCWCCDEDKVDWEFHNYCLSCGAEMCDDCAEDHPLMTKMCESCQEDAVEDDDYC